MIINALIAQSLNLLKRVGGLGLILKMDMIGIAFYFSLGNE